MLGPGRPERFNFVEYLHASGGGDSSSVTDAIMEIVDLADKRGGKGDKGNQFFNRYSRRTVASAVDVVSASGERMSLSAILDVITGAPQTPDQADDRKWRDESRSAYYFQAADDRARGLPEEKRKDYEQARGFFFGEYASLAGETGSSVRATITSVLDPFSRSPLRELFCTTTTWRPEDAFEKGDWLLIDMPTHKYGFASSMAQVLIKYAIQKAAQRRVRPDRPCLLVMDECQELMSGNDQQFACVARSSRVAMLAMTQNVSNLLRTFGDPDEVNSLVGNFRNKWFFSVDDKPTAELASFMAGEAYDVATGGGQDWDYDPFALFGREKDQRQNLNWREERRAAVEPAEFARLRTGGAHGYAEAVLFSGGRTFSNGLHYLLVKMPQWDV
ncbi:type IV secretory system conjugative DNA transfer family protein [Paludisphaera rhizosphaerae]|uniref:type IV secretory system conjugative DNA transfer family protein n=1 Tax=Paludisphaera rhizosphaerae TaxID=2711216 RepID=UPI001F0D5345|nr:TraM recognition domain-containing protein [Paludisphaera rhizosphaerae]